MCARRLVSFSHPPSAVFCLVCILQAGSGCFGLPQSLLLTHTFLRERKDDVERSSLLTTMAGNAVAAEEKKGKTVKVLVTPDRPGSTTQTYTLTAKRI